MADDKYTFEQARIRLEEIAAEVRKKDTSLEKSLDLLEEGVRLANICTELVDHTDTAASVTVPRPQVAEPASAPADDFRDGSPEDPRDVSDVLPAEADESVGPDDDIDGFEDVEGSDEDPFDPASPETEA